MQRFKINWKPDSVMFINAFDYQDAAVKAARRIHAKRRLTALRTTGGIGMSGYFCAYEAIDRGGLSSYGEPFHVTTVD